MINSASIPTARFLALDAKRRRRGFSLIEVAIAIGVISVSLVALVGLTAATLQTGKAAAGETTMTTAANEVLDVLRARTFTKLPYMEPAPAKNLLETATEESVLPTVYVAHDGQWLSPDRSEWPSTGATAAPPQDDAAYQCVVTIEPDAATLTPQALSNPGTETSVNLLRVRLALSPVTAAGNAKPTLLIHATIPRQ